MPKDNLPHPKAAILAKLVDARIKEQPFEFDGQTWAAAPQEWWAKQLGVSAVTVRRIIKMPPFIRNWAQVGGVVTALLRVGEKGPQTDLDRAKVMRRIWFKKLGENEHTTVGQQRWGCLCALAKMWGEHAPSVFSTVLNNWPLFMSFVKHQPDWTIPRFFQFPSISVMRRFAPIGAELWLMQEHSKQGGSKDVSGLEALLSSMPKTAG